MSIVSVLVIISSVLMIGSMGPYLSGIIKKTVKPRVVSWFIWAILNAISFAATIADGQFSTAAFIACLLLASIAVTILGWRNGDKKIGLFDGVCFLGALIGIVLWWLFNSPSIAIIAALVIDFLGWLPTLRHCWQKPNEEQWVTFLLSFLGSVVTLSIVDGWKITSVAYPIYMIFNSSILVIVVLARRRILLKSKTR